MRIKHKVWFSLNEYPINSRKLHCKFQTKSEMESINIIISAAKADWGWSANNLALQVFAYHTLKVESICPCCLPSYLPFFCWHPVQKCQWIIFPWCKGGIDAQKVFLSRMKSDKDLSMEHLADKISKWRTLEDSVSACLMRDTIKRHIRFLWKNFPMSMTPSVTSLCA